MTSLGVSGDAQVDQNLIISKNITAQNGLGNFFDVNINGLLDSKKDAIIRGNLTVNGKINGDLQIQNPTFSGDITLENSII